MHVLEAFGSVATAGAPDSPLYLCSAFTRVAHLSYRSDNGRRAGARLAASLLERGRVVRALRELEG